MEYPILDELLEHNNARKEQYMKDHNTFFISQIEEMTDNFSGSSDNLRLFIFRNYIHNDSLCDLAIVIRDLPSRRKNDVAVVNVETSIFPIGAGKAVEFQNSAVLAPELHPEVEKFILEKRSLPKKRYGIKDSFNPDRDKWPVELIAKHLHMSNRTIAKYCKAMNI